LCFLLTVLAITSQKKHTDTWLLFTYASLPKT